VGVAGGLGGGEVCDGAFGGQAGGVGGAVPLKGGEVWQDVREGSGGVGGVQNGGRSVGGSGEEVRARPLHMPRRGDLGGDGQQQEGQERGGGAGGGDTWGKAEGGAGGGLYLNAVPHEGEWVTPSLSPKARLLGSLIGAFSVRTRLL